MTMRAPSLASLAAVAAPRPEADPVITTHIPSLAICISFCCRVPSFRGAAPLARRTRNPEASHEAGFRVRAEEARPGMTLWAIYHIGRREQVGSSPSSGKSAIAFRSMPPSRGNQRTSALVRGGAFPHHGPNKGKTGNAVAESENIVAETAERIFADLADAQTINSDREGNWKAPLWQALTDAGLPLA